MKARAMAAFAATDGSVAVALPLAYVLGSGSCAAMISCFLRDILCPLVCVNPWDEVPGLLVFGLAAGVIPAVAVAAAVAWQGDDAPRRIVPLPFGMSALPLALVGYAALFDTGGVVLGALSLTIAAPLLAIFSALAARWGGA